MKFHLAMIMAMAGCALASPAFAQVVQPGATGADPQPVLQQFLTAHPGAGLSQEGDIVSRVYGPAFGSGTDPENTAEQFRASYAGLFGADPSDLAPVSRLRDGRHTQPLMYDRETGGYKFTLVYFSQFRGGLPVFGADLRLLVRNEANYPLVLAASGLRNLGAFTVDPILANMEFDPALQTNTGMTRFSSVEKVIWAGVNDRAAEPVLAVTFIGENDRTDAGYEKWRFVCDAATGEVLHRETMIHFVDVTGNVQAMATPGPKAGICTPEVLWTYPWGKVDISGGSTVYADGSGNFTIPNPGTAAVTVRSYVDGLYFTIDNRAGAEETLSTVVTPPGPANFIHNQADTDDLVLAQTNIYTSGNMCRDWILAQNPSFPGVPTDFGVLTVVNRTDFYCPCNAWSDGSDGSINFCQPGSGCPNTAWQSVLNHEYGHHIIDFTSSGQGEYGEGMGDCIAILPVDDPNLGYGFFGDCNAGLRTADNTCQYSASSCSSCGSEIHDCGNLLSGIVWDIRDELLITHPTDYLDIISSIVVNSILLHTGTGINAQVAIDFLTVDDDDGDITNGTPHRTEICAGFTAHGLSCPALVTGMNVTPTGGFASSGPPGGPFTPSSINYTVKNLGTTSINYTVAKTQSWVTLSGTGGTLAGGASAIITVSINATAGSLGTGTYNDTVAFTNTTNHQGDTTRPVTLQVLLPTLAVTPADGFSSAGSIGGPFTPGSKVYTLQNIGFSSLNYTVAKTQSWVTLSGTGGTLAGQASTTITVSINANADSLPLGTYGDTVTFVNTTNGLGNTTRAVSLQVNPISNDYCANAFVTCPGMIYTGTTAGKNVDGSTSCGTSDTAPDVWYKYTAGASGTAIFSLCSGTGYDSVMSIHTGCPGTSGNTLDCNDDACGMTSNAPSEITLSVTAGTEYLIRVSGWSGASGNYTLTLSGPDCSSTVLEITFPSGLPTVLPTGSTTSFDVQITDGSEIYVPGSGMLHYRYHGGSYQTSSLASLGGNLYRATLPPATCDSTPEFYVSAQSNGGTTVTNPIDAPTSVYVAIVGTASTVMDDAFETDQGWTVGDTGDTATTGIWTRNVPQATTAQPGADHSEPGTLCWVTDYRAGSGAGDYDVDNGKTTVKSPVLNLAGYADATIGYWRWYSNSTGGDPNADTFRVDITNNGTTWTNAETVGPSGPGTSGGWFYHEFNVADFVTPTAQVRLRFIAEDASTGSLIEAALDDVKIVAFNCTDVPACATILGDMNGNSVVNGADMQGFVSALTGAFDPCADFNGNLQMDVGDIDGMVNALLGP